MTAYIKFTPLSGALNEDPLCYLLEVDEAKILLDCGWTDEFDPATLTYLKRIAKGIDAVLFSHADLEHLGAFPYAYGHLGLNCPAYATVPVHDMGQICMYDAYQSRTSVEDFNTFTLDDVDSAFDRMVQLRYSQPYSLAGKCKGITITAYSAGHSIGGTVWRIKKDTDEIVYAVDYNHRKDRHLNGTLLNTIEALAKPSVLITDAYNALVEQPLRRTRENWLTDVITETLKSQGSILIPVDSSTRVLELAYLLDQHWSISRLPNPLFFLSYQSFRTMSLARTMLEWMGDDISQSFTQKRDVPFDFKFLRTVYRMQEIDKIPGPKVVLASMPSLETGWSNQILQQWCSRPENLVLLPDRGRPGSLARQLYQTWDATSVVLDDGSNMRPPVVVDQEIPIQQKLKIPLEGDELAEALTRQRHLHESELLLKSQALAPADDDDDESEMSQDDEPVQLLMTSGYDIYVKDQIRPGGFFKQQSQGYRMFPLAEARKRVDDYGEQIDPAVFERGEYQYAIQQATLESEQPQPMDLETIRPVEDTIPSKYTLTDILLPISCKVMYIDFEGRSDGPSIRNILPQMTPRKLILVHGTQDSTTHLVTYCLDNEGLTNEVFMPNISDCINVSSATDIYQIKLTDTLVSSLKMATLGDYELAYVTGILRGPETTDPSSSSTTTTETFPPGTVPTLDIISSTYPVSHPSVIVGDLRLSEFRKKLLQKGYQADFVQGALIVNRKIVVRKAGAGSLTLEGPVCAEYAGIRKLLYDQHAVI
ncbi:beta-lactamase-like protein [Phlyctochytrium arcticum]|nr:beta-lactamase-like protein [Phlyctochytrium arcticum]